jgi:hypothetical protein
MEADARSHDPANPGKGDPEGLDLSVQRGGVLGISVHTVSLTARSRAGGRGPRWLVQSPEACSVETRRRPGLQRQPESRPGLGAGNTDLGLGARVGH